jgi:hypothetical protein
MKLISAIAKIMLIASILIALWGGTIAASEKLMVQIHKHALLVEDGQAVVVTVKVKCDAAGYQAMEAFLYVVQDEQESRWGRIPVTCDGRMHRSTVHVWTDEPFRSGEARVSSYILLCDALCEETISANIVELIRIR